MHAKLLHQSANRAFSTRLRHASRGQGPLRWNAPPVQQLQQQSALPSGAPPQQPSPLWSFWMSPVADVRAAPRRAAAGEAGAAARGPQRFDRLRVKGDGACMFRSVAQGDALLRTGQPLKADQEWEAAQRLRRDVVEQLRSSRSDIEPFIPGIIEGTEDFESYLERMSRPATWGGEPELAMAVKVLKRPIAVYQPTMTGQPQHIITYGNEYDEAPMHVLWSGAHYDLMIPVVARSKL